MAETNLCQSHFEQILLVHPHIKDLTDLELGKFFESVVYTSANFLFCFKFVARSIDIDRCSPLGLRFCKSKKSIWVSLICVAAQLIR
jgi:hypothetical protein